MTDSPVIEKRHPGDSPEFPPWRDSSEEADEMHSDTSQASSPTNQDGGSGDLDHANSAPQSPSDQVSDDLFVPEDSDSEDSEDTELEDTPDSGVSDHAHGQERDLVELGQAPGTHSEPLPPHQEAEDPSLDALGNSDPGIYPDIKSNKVPSTKSPAKKREKHRISKKDATRGFNLGLDRLLEPDGGAKKKQQRKILNQQIISDTDYDDICTVDYPKISRENAALDPVLDSDLADKRKAMDEIITSVPDADKQVAKLDSRMVIEASRVYRGLAKHVSGKWKVKGLETTLYHYQLTSGAWIIERESQGAKPRGGLLCHEMGLGKTLIMLAVIHNERQAVNDKKPAISEPAIGPTLIVAPSPLVTHWVQEIVRHCDDSVVFVRHDSKSRTERPNVSAFFQEQQIVITTYHQITASFPFLKCPEGIRDPRDVKKWWETVYPRELGPFHKVDWHRIILDEGQVIRNRNVKTSIAVRALGGQRKWVVTGTPLLNRTEEIYSYLEFLRVPGCESFEKFEVKYCTGSKRAKEQLKKLLHKIMLRKTHKSRLFGAPLLELPKLTEKIVAVDFCSTEAFIHEELAKCLVKRVNDLVGDPERQKFCILELILKQRMFISHLLVAQNYIEMILNDHVMSRLKSLASEEYESHDNSAIIARLLVTVVEETTFYATLPAVDVNNDSERSNPREDLSLIPQFQDLMHSLSLDEDHLEILQRKNCAMCGNPSHHFFLASCLHRYCEACFAILPDEHGKTDTAGRKCLGCKTSIEGVVFCYDSYGSNDSSPEGTTAANSPGRKRSNVTHKSSQKEGGDKKRRKQNKQLVTGYQKWSEDRQRARETGGLGDLSSFNGVEPELEAAQKLDWVDQIGILTPGAKHTEVQRQIETWLTSDKDAKIVVFAEFLGSIQLLQHMCLKSNWESVTISGKSSIRAREIEVEKFRDKEDLRVLIATMRTGGIGLNLTMANKCIICDQWWNAAMEQQAYCRLHRIGQHREVEYVKIVVNNTIDDYILKMQQRKTNEINELMSGKQLTDREMIKGLLSHFGDVSEHKGGGLWISSRPKHA